MNQNDIVRGVDFSRLPLYWKMLVTGFVVILGAGYLAAAINAALAVGISPAAIADHYGDRSLTDTERVQMEQQGFVEEEFSLDEEDEDMAATDGAMSHDMKGMAGGSIDDSLPPQILAQLAHIHLLGFSLLLLAIGSLFCLTRLNSGAKTFLVTLLFISFLGDIAGLNLTRFVSPGFAWLTMIAGTTIGICLALMILRVLWELWVPRTVAV